MKTEDVSMKTDLNELLSGLTIDSAITYQRLSIKPLRLARSHRG